MLSEILRSVGRREYCHTGAELLNVGSHGPWSDSLQLQASLLAPVEELPDGDGIGLPGVPIADVRREELKRVRSVNCVRVQYAASGNQIGDEKQGLALF